MNPKNGEPQHLWNGGGAGYADGGTVDEEERDPSIIPEEIKDFIEKAHKAQRESRPDEAWHITSPEKPESIAPYKRDEEEEDEEPSDRESIESPSLPNFDQGGEVPGYADGGGPDIGPSSFDVDGGASDTVKMNGQPASLPPPAPAQVPNPVSMAAPAPPAPADLSPGAMTPKPPISAPQQLTDQDFVARANKMLGLDPGQQAGFLKLLGGNAQKAQIGAGIAGIGDAIASGGTLGKVNPGALNKSEDLIQDRTKEGIEGMQTIRGNQEKTTELALKLQAEDPNSPLSKYAQKAYGSLGKKLGLDLSHASASLISDITGKGVAALNDEAELGLKQASLGLQKEQIEATIGNQKAERQQARDVRQQEAAKVLADRGILKTVANAIPGTAGHAATKVLERTAAGEQPPAGPIKVNSMEEYKALPSGTHYMDSYGKEKVKK